MNEHLYERKLMGYVGGDDDAPEWYAICSCGWRGPLRIDPMRPYNDFREHLSIVAPDRPDAAWLPSAEVAETHLDRGADGGGRWRG